LAHSESSFLDGILAALDVFHNCATFPRGAGSPRCAAAIAFLQSSRVPNATSAPVSYVTASITARRQCQIAAWSPRNGEPARILIAVIGRPAYHDPSFAIGGSLVLAHRLILVAALAGGLLPIDRLRGQ
jgi:hypothetical protein